MNSEQRETIRHSLGLDEYGHGREYRNFFMTSPDCADGKLCDGLVEFGMMVRDPRYPSEISGGDHCWHVTELGRSTFLAECPKPKKKTRAELRYDEFVSADCGLTFGEWLKRKFGKKVTT